MRGVPVLAAALAILAMTSLAIHSLASTEIYLGMDLRAFYVNGRLWNHGVVPYGRLPDPGEPGPLNYPPGMLLLFSWLAAAWSYSSVRLGFWAVQLALLVVSLGWLRVRRAPALLWILAGLSAPIALQFERGQVEMVILALLVAALAGLRSGATATSGVLLGLAASVKLYPGLLVGYMVLRSRRMLLAFMATVVLILGATSLWMGPEATGAFLRTLPGVGGPAPARSVHSGYLERTDPRSLQQDSGFLTASHSRIVQADGREYLYGTYAMAESQAAARALFYGIVGIGAGRFANASTWIVLALVVLVAGTATLRGGAGADEELSLWLMGALLAHPRAWPFTYVLSLVPMAVLFDRLLDEEEDRPLIWAVIAVAMIAIHAPPPPVGGTLGWRVWPGPLVGGVLLFALLAYRVGRRKTAFDGASREIGPY